MRLLLFLLASSTFALPTIAPDAKPGGLTIPSLDTPNNSPDFLSFFTSAPTYIAKSISTSDTACSISRVLPIFCGEHSLDERQTDSTTMAEEVQTCGTGFEGWLCSVMTHTALLAFVFLIVAPLLALGIYKWKKVRLIDKDMFTGTNDNSTVEEASKEATTASDRAPIIRRLQSS